MAVSRFHSLRDTRPHPTTWEAIIREITDGTHAAATERYRLLLQQTDTAIASGDTATAERLKQQKPLLKQAQPAILVSVETQDGRTNAHIIRFTNYIMVDIDDIPTDRFHPILQKVKADPYPVLVHTTLSGRGIRVIVRAEGEVNRQNFSTVWQQVNEYYATLTGIAIDKQCKNPTRMSVLCHDPEALYRPDATPFALSGTSENETQKRKRGRPVTAGHAAPTVRKQVEKEGATYTPGNYNDYVSRCLYWMNRYGVAQTDARTWALSTFPDYNPELLAPIVKSCYALTDEHASMHLPHASHPETGNGTRKAKASMKDMETFIRNYMELRLNLLTHQTEVKLKTDNDWQRMTDHIENSLWCAMQRDGIEVEMFRLHTLITSDFVKEYHPLKEYLDNLPPWDGITDHIASLAAMIHVKGGRQHFTEAFRRWLVGIIAGGLDENTVNQVILTLIGPQGCYKTSFMQHLLPPVLASYYTTKANSQRLSKDDLFTMTEYLLVNYEEIDTMQPAELNQLKAMVTQKYVDERPPYGRHKVHLPHVASFCATGNNVQFLTDDTGNRRWLPFEVEHIDNPWTARIPYEEVYAQAYTLFRNGFRYWFTDKEIQELRSHVCRFETPKPEYELIQTYYRKPAELERGSYVTASQILQRFGNGGLRLNIVRVGRAMSKLGFEKARVNGTDYWVVVERPLEEVLHLLPGEAENSASLD